MASPSEELPDPGEVPALDWIDKTLITVDPLYQRPLDAERAATIARSFSWRSFGALVVAPAGEGYHVTDGQHRLEAAKLHSKVTHVPAVIVQAETVQDKAGVFVAVNRDRKNVSALELFFAELAAGDGRATQTLKFCQRVGLRIPKYPGNFKPNDTIAVAQIGALVSGYTDSRVIEFLTVAAAGNFAPVTAAQLRAVEHLLTMPEFKNQIIADDLAAFLTATGRSLDGEAKRFSATHNVPFWKGLANVWFQKCKKRRQPAKLGSAENPSSTGLPKNPVVARPLVRPEIAARAAELAARNAPLPRQNVTASVFGDPPAGRSALDQRKASA
jgi:hypothetical protein